MYYHVASGKLIILIGSKGCGLHYHIYISAQMAVLCALLLFLLPLCRLTESQNSYLNCSSDTKYPLHFVGFFPCLDNEDATQLQSSGCRLPLAAVEHAIALVNRDDDLLRCFRIELFPITVRDPQQVSLWSIVRAGVIL